MLPFKNQEDFQRWKESNHWVWEYLAYSKAQIDEQTRSYASTVLVCTEDRLDHMRRETSALAGMSTAFSQIEELTFEKISAVPEAFA